VATTGSILSVTSSSTAAVSTGLVSFAFSGAHAGRLPVPQSRAQESSRSPGLTAGIGFSVASNH
jgi:hypothetical protein